MIRNHASDEGDSMSDQHREVELLTPAEVAATFRMDPNTVNRWANAGMLSSIRTPGGPRRYKASEIEELLSGLATPRIDSFNRDRS